MEDCHPDAKVAAEAQAIASTANLLAETFHQIQQMLAHNADMAIDWGAAEKPAYIDEDGSGNLSGLNVSRQQIANAVGSLDAVRALLANEELTWQNPGDHLGNLHLIIPPSAVRVSVRS